VDRSERWIEYFTKRLREAQAELARLRNAISQHGLRVFTRDPVNGERDMTDEHLRQLEDSIKEYRTLLKND
jgi:hypothetical protein